jgi:hypothetical protein
MAVFLLAPAALLAGGHDSIMTSATR